MSEQPERKTANLTVALKEADQYVSPWRRTFFEMLTVVAFLLALGTFLTVITR